MNQPTKRTLQAIDTKNRICAAAARLMEQKGFESITIEQISKAAKVSIGAFYHHYSSKNDILYEIFQRADHFFRDQVIGQLSGECATERIVCYFDHFAQFYTLLGVDHIKALYKTQSKIFVDQDRYMITVLRDIIQRGVDQKELTPTMQAEEILDFLLAFARGLAYTWCLHDGRYPFQDAMHRYMARLAKTLTP